MKHSLIKIAGFIFLLFSAQPGLTFEDEIVGESGFTNPVDLNERYYLEQMKRKPDQLGLICWASYEIHKEGRHNKALTLLHACADRGLVVPMFMLSNMYDLGQVNGMQQSKVSILWLKRAAATGDSRGQFYYGQALMKNAHEKNSINSARRWIELAAVQGESEAIEWLAEH